MLSLDEAITHAREKAEEMYLQGMICHANPNDDELDGCIECAKEHEQLAEWLEELKKRRSEDYGYMADIHQSIGYRKAIDDFVNACKEDILCQIFGLHPNGIEKISEQLKEGINK